MTIEVANTETIDGVKVEYLTDWDSRFVSKELKAAMQSWGQQIAPIAKKKGFMRVQIGSHGDLYHMGITTGRLVAINTMYVARFLKR